MQCDVRSMSDRCSDEDVNGETGLDRRQGLVNQVCREWLVREDEVVAHKLQDEEFQHHYGSNRSKNKIVREDTQQARNLQTHEEEVAAEVQEQLELMCIRQEEEDAQVAKEVQEMLCQQEVEKLRHLQEADEQYARHLQDKEKERIQKKKRDKEMRQVEQALAHQAAVANQNYLQEASNEFVENTDFSDLCMQPTPDMDPLETKVLQEQQDEELARLLQEQESKRGTSSNLDKKLAVETQDREIAKYLQEQERAKAKKARERAKQKALQQQLEKDETEQPASEIRDDSSDLSSTLDSSSVRSKGESSRGSLHSASKESSQMSNIAMAIDPTYNAKSPTSTKLQASTPYSAPSTPAKSSIPIVSSPDRPSYQMEIRNLLPEGNYCSSDRTYEDEAVPPYMPIQGQRRTGSLEKQSSKKNKKDSCKNQ